MPNATWPVGLPLRPLLEGYQESPPDTMLRTEMEAGPAKMRQRYTAAPRPVAATILVKTKALLDTFDAFFVTTLAGGTLPFDWGDRNNATKTFRFTEKPVYEPISGAWHVRMKLEQLP